MRPAPLLRVSWSGSRLEQAFWSMVPYCHAHLPYISFPPQGDGMASVTLYIWL